MAWASTLIILQRPLLGLQSDPDSFEDLSDDDDDYTPYIVPPTPIEAALDEDNKDLFATLIKPLSEYELSHAYFDLLTFDSINCFTAMHAGDLAPFLDTNLLANEDGSPLHGAASFPYGCPKITSFLIHQGYSPDLRADLIFPDYTVKDALPLTIALESYIAYLWRGGSAIHFFTSFWDAPRRKYETIAILARNTCEFKHEFFKYLKQAKMVEVGILLAVARDCILSSSTTQGNNDDMGFKDISEMRNFLSAEILKLSVDATTAQSECKAQLLEMNNTLQLLDIFDKIGDDFIALTQTTQNGASEVETLIKDAGFDVESLKTNSEFSMTVRVQVDDRGLLPSSFDEQKYCDQFAQHVASNINQTPVPISKFPMPSSISWSPTQVTITFGKAQVSGGVGSGNEV